VEDEESEGESLNPIKSFRQKRLQSKIQKLEEELGFSECSFVGTSKLDYSKLPLFDKVVFGFAKFMCIGCGIFALGNVLYFMVVEPYLIPVFIPFMFVIVMFLIMVIKD